jgi:hypothetical protein
VFLILSADSIDASVLADVSNTWPALCVFLYSEQMDDQQLAREFPQVQPIDPPLGAAEEDLAYAQWGHCAKVAEWASGGKNSAYE